MHQQLFSYSLSRLMRLLLSLSILLCPLVLFATGGNPVTLEKVYSGNIAYIADGASFRNQPNGINACSIDTSSTISISIPVGATILDAYLYFAGSGETGTLDINDQPNLRLNGFLISPIAGLNDRNFTDLSNLAPGFYTGLDFFGARRDVSAIVTGSGAYTLSDMNISTLAVRNTSQTCLAAWGLVVVYEDPAVSNIRVINLFDGFAEYHQTSLDLQPRNFVVDTGSPSGKMTHLSFEGDTTVTGTEEFSLEVGGSGLLEQTNAINPSGAQFNDTVSGPDVFDVNTEYGLDLDTYDISSILSTEADSYTATTRYETGTDLVLLMMEIISIDNKNLADIEISIDDVGLFLTGSSNAVQYVISVNNNGDGTSNPSTGFATGYIHVYDDLPTGISIDSMGDITAPGWDCSATVLVSNQLRCSYDLSGLPGAQLDKGDSLPNINITVDVATPTSPVTNIARVSLCANDPDTCTTFNEKHTDADQFDPKNFFESFEDIFDITNKSTANNNVDAEITAIISGSPSDLSTSTKTVVDINGGTLDLGDTIEYTITLTETAAVTATGVSISDVLDGDVSNYAFQSTTCSFASNVFSAGTLTISGITVTASSSCNVVYRVDVGAFASAGTAIDNTALITNGNGLDAAAVAPTLLVAGLATGSKVLYLDQVNTGQILTRTAPVSDTSTSVATSNSISLSLNPVLAQDLDINNGIIPVSVWIEAANAGDYDITARLNYDGAGANTLIGSNSLNNITMATGTVNAQLFPFQINLGSDIIDFDTGEDLILTITNGGGSPGAMIVHSLLSGIDSTVVIDAANVINVDNVGFYSDPARTLSIVSIEAGQVIYIEAVISDPFGAFDISGAKLSLIDPSLASQLSNVTMSLDAGATTTASKTFFYAYTVPAATSISPGTWSVQVTGLEGAEGTISHTEVNTFFTTAPSVDVDYSVSTITASGGDLLSYTILVTNSGASVPVDISQAIPIGTNGLNITTLPSGSSVLSTSSLLDIQNLIATTGTTTVIFTVNVDPGALPGDLIDHTISLDNSGTIVSDPAATVLIDPFLTHSGNKPIYADNFSGSPILDRSIPVADTIKTILSQGGSSTLNLSPVLQGDLVLEAGTIEASIWVSRGASFAGIRTVQATLAYAGVSTGTIGSDTVTIDLDAGLANAQYLPFNFTVPSDLTILANSSLTLTITNNTVTSGEDITIHTFKDNIHSSLVSLDALTPLTIEAIEVFNNDIDSGGVLIATGAPSTEIWLRATIADPFGPADITSATLTVTDPLSAVTLTAAAMAVPSTQPAAANQKYFQLNHTLSAELGDWTLAVTALEGDEGLVSASDSVLFNVNNDSPTLTDSYKYVSNTTTGDLGDTNVGDTLHYTIELVETGGAAASGVSVTDTIPVDTSFVPGSLTIDAVVQADPAPNINLTGLTVAALGTITIEFDVTIDGGLSAGTIIANTADITNPSGVITAIPVLAQDLVISGAPASGTKNLYFKDLDTSPFLTRSQPQTADLTDDIIIQNAGGSVTLDLAALVSDITIDPIDGDIEVTLRMQRQGANNRNRSMQVDVGYHNGGSVTALGSVTQNANLSSTIQTYLFTITPAAITTIPSGNQIRITVTNLQNQNNRDARIYSFDSGSNRSKVDIIPTPVINVDSITFWSDTMGAGSLVTNPDPDASSVDIYAKIVISDPFGEDDIRAPDAASNATTVSMTNPDANVSLGATTSCVAPCYAYDGEDTTNDLVGDATRTFYYIVRLDADPPATRGTWTFQVTANEGLETGLISHIAADSFTTLKASNLSTSTKTHNNIGDIDPSDLLTYVITLNNTGGEDADNVIFSDTLQVSPVSLTFVSATTSCTDELAAALPSPSHAAGVVSLSNISVTGGGSCTITINATVGAGSPGDLIDNTAIITNPGGVGATALAATILLTESAIPVAGSKQLYVEGLDGTSLLSRTQPTTTSEVILSGNDGRVETLNLDNVTSKEMTLATGLISVNLYLRETGGGNKRLTEVELFVDANFGSGFVSVGNTEQNLTLTGTATLRTLSFTNASAVPLNIGASFRLVITNNTTQNNRLLYVSQVTSGSYSEIVMPLINSIEVTEVKFFDRSASDETGDPGCTPSCGSEVDPGLVESGFTLWTRVTIADGFGSADVNTGCDGVTATNCPTITVTDPTSADQTPISPADELSFVQAADSTSRQFEFEVNPAGFGLEGIWLISILGKEGLEDQISDIANASFERYGPPILTIVKTVTGTTTPGQIVTYHNDVNNTGTGPATTVVLTNEIGAFLALELTENAGSWTAVLSLSGLYTISTEEFDSGDDLYSYDPVATCGAALPINSPCYDNNITKWRIELNENIPVGGNVLEQYRSKIE